MLSRLPCGMICIVSHAPLPHAPGESELVSSSPTFMLQDVWEKKHWHRLHRVFVGIFAIISPRELR
jgi:hypothetical protein